jgi:outer membrane protein assembly factor BamB
MPSRRAFLTVLGASAATAALAGCTGTADDPPDPGVDSLPDPDRNVYGADGEWSSFGCNASNTRTVADGEAPVDGVTERWRVEAAQIGYAEPIVAGGRVYQSTARRLVAYDAADGTELWTKTGVDEQPLVIGDVVYADASDGLLAFAAETGETLWKQTFDESGAVRTPATYGGDWLYIPVGETIYRLDAETGEVDWSRRLFGTLLGPPAIYSGYFVAIVSEAGKLYVLGPDGTGGGEWNLPSVPQAPPTADTDRVYVACRNGRTYAIDFEDEPSRTIAWNAETGWASAGLAVERNVYAVGTGGLHAIDPEAGERIWEHDTGDWRWTAPALGRDTLFVGGDALYAFDPTPDSGLFGDGPVLRFEETFHGRVGPGPVLNDGVVYVVAQTGEESFHLLALE